MTTPTSRPPGGLQIEYARKKPLWKVRRPPELDWDLDEHVTDWIQERTDAIYKARQSGPAADEGAIDYLAGEALDRHMFCCIGHSQAAWIERTVTTAATLLDYRSRQFGRRLLDPESWAQDWVEWNLDSLEVNAESPKSRIPLRPLDSVERAQLVATMTFAVEWQKYLIKLLVRPPGRPAPPDYNFPSDYDEPGRDVCWELAELGHCRPAGAFFSSWYSDPWLQLGGREECRKRLTCPHCHARYVTRLVERVQQGPWRPGRQNGRQLVLLRAAVPTSQLRLDSGLQDAERDELGFEGWLRSGVPYYSADDGIKTTIRNLDVNQDLADTLTPCEVRAAGQILTELLDRARAAGIQGGLRLHSIGPSGRQFQHEMSIVGEVRARDTERLAREFGVPGEDAQIHGCPIECVILPRGYRDAARLLLAGSAWKFDLDHIGAEFNAEGYRRTHWPAPSDAPLPQDCVGLRGALAWQPLFLLSSVAFWSRVRVLKTMKFKSVSAFGTWQRQLPSDRQHRTATQRRRWAQNGGPIKEGHARNPILVLQKRIRKASVSHAQLARSAACSRSAVSRFMTSGHGGPELIQKLRVALSVLEATSNVDPPQRMIDPASVRRWLKETGRTQGWLAKQMDLSPSQVSRYLNERSAWSDDFARAVELLAGSDCTMFTAPQVTESASTDAFVVA